MAEASSACAMNASACPEARAFCIGTSYPPPYVGRLVTTEISKLRTPAAAAGAAARAARDLLRTGIVFRPPRRIPGNLLLYNCSRPWAARRVGPHGPACERRAHTLTRRWAHRREKGATLPAVRGGKELPRITRR